MLVYNSLTAMEVEIRAQMLYYFTMYGQKVIKDAMTKHQTDALLGGNTSYMNKDAITVNPSVKSGGGFEGGTSKAANTLYCYSFSDMNIASGGGFYGVVYYTMSADHTKTDYYLFLTDNTYYYAGNLGTIVLNDSGGSKSIAQPGVYDNIKAAMEACPAVDDTEKLS